MTELLSDLKPAVEGEWMLSLMEELYPMPRSITGEGFRKTQRVLAKHVEGLELEEVPSGTQVFDWTVPKEWNVAGARIRDAEGRTVVDFADHPLHLVNYSTPVDSVFTLDELQQHLHSEPGQPDVIPYRTSYYEEDWGFCLRHQDAERLQPGDYRVEIESELSDGVLNYGEWSLPGESEEEILVSAHACHPAQCNDNLSGVVVAAAVARSLGRADPRRSYRVLFLPGGIGSVVWMWRNRERLDRVAGGVTLGCLGDPAPLSYKETRQGDALTDKAVSVAWRDAGFEFNRTPFSPYGFDERNFNSPRHKVPIGSVTRSPHGAFPGYHTSADDLSTMEAERLGESLHAVLAILEAMESERLMENLIPDAEPQLGKRGLYGATGGLKERKAVEMAMLWVMNLSDGSHSLIDVALRSELPLAVVAEAASLLESRGLLRPLESP